MNMLRQHVYATSLALLSICLVYGWTAAQTPEQEEPQPSTTLQSIEEIENAASTPGQATESVDDSGANRAGEADLNTSKQSLFQGVLTKNGQAVNGAKTAYYLLFDSLNFCNESPIAPGDGTAISVSTQVNDGLFSVRLSETSITSGLFDGRKLYLKLGVKGYGLLANCEEILPTPYAISLAPGASIRNGTASAVRLAPGSTAIDVTNTTGNALKADVSTSYTVVYAHNRGSGGGIYGSTGASDQAGVYGRNTAFAGGRGAYGVLGETSIPGSLGAAVRGNSRSSGLAGYFTTERHVAVLAVNDAPSTSKVATLEIQNNADDGTGHLITAWNGSDLEFWVQGDGDVTADGSFTGGGADYADMLPVSGDLSTYDPGDVLVIDGNGKMAKSTEPNATTVAGIYSTKPAFVGNRRGITDSAAAQRSIEVVASVKTEAEDYVQEEPDDRVPVALVGVVPTKVSAENGAINPGDLLTTSSTPGHAMKASAVTVGGVEIYPSGSILGKAMEPLASGVGVIDVLITLR